MPFNLKNLLARGPEMIQAERVFIREIPLQELGFTVLYILIAGLWYVFSNDVFEWVTDRTVDSPAVQTEMGINFVITTGLLLYVVLRQTVRTRRLAEEALRLSQQRFESVALATTDAIWDLNLDTQVIWWSDGIQKLFGYRPEDVSTKFEWWLERLHPEDKDRVMESLKRVLDGGAPTWTSQYRFRCQDGSYAVVLDRGYIMRDPAEKPVRMVGGMSDISERRRAEEALESSRRQLRALTARLQSGREEERTNVAREIHDELGQVLTALKINLDWLERKLGEREDDPSLNPLLDRVVESGEMTESAIGSVQRIATDLRPALLDNLGLAEALREEATRFQQRSGIACALHLPSPTVELPREACTAVFRVFQEALTNVARHAQATEVRVSLESNSERVVLEVEDNGHGIRPDAVGDSRSLGLLGMRERASVLGGDLAITSIEPRGTRVTMRLPQAADETRFWANL